MVLLISHRFSTVRLADYIYVLEKGGISEGTACTSGQVCPAFSNPGDFLSLINNESRSISILYYAAQFDGFMDNHLI